MSVSMSFPLHLHPSIPPSLPLPPPSIPALLMDLISAELRPTCSKCYCGMWHADDRGWAIGRVETILYPLNPLLCVINKRKVEL